MITGLLSRAQAAERLGLMPQTLAGWAVKGIGPKYVKFCGGRVRYHPDDLADWIASHTRCSTSEPAR